MCTNEWPTRFTLAAPTSHYIAYIYTRRTWLGAPSRLWPSISCPFSICISATLVYVYVLPALCLFCCQVPSFSYLHHSRLAIHVSHSRILRVKSCVPVRACNKTPSLSLYCRDTRAQWKGRRIWEKKKSPFFTSFRVIITMHYFNCYIRVHSEKTQEQWLKYHKKSF